MSKFNKMCESIINNADNYRKLINASRDGNLDLVKELVKQGVDIRAKKDEAFRSAADYGHLAVVKYLVEKGANIHAEHNEAIRNAKLAGHTEVVHYLASIK